MFNTISCCSKHGILVIIAILRIAPFFTEAFFHPSISPGSFGQSFRPQLTKIPRLSSTQEDLEYAYDDSGAESQFGTKEYWGELKMQAIGMLDLHSRDII